MTKKIKLAMAMLCISLAVSAQKDTVKLKEIVISANRISLPISETSRTVTVITQDIIRNSPVTNITELLQQVAGVDVRRRGVEGMQSDLYIRGGNFEQTLVLIDGVKMDDVQTGHHTMNAMISLDNVARIEIVKGPAARVYGQNAMAGAINIVTKTVQKDGLNLDLGYGSFENQKVAAGIQKVFNEKNSLSAHSSFQKSEGYRPNTDFENLSFFVKTKMNKINLLSTYMSRAFGAENFYTSNPNFNEYEETQTSLVSLNTEILSGSVKIMPRLYWRRNQDIFVLKRNDPGFYRNLHISNKIGFETNMTFDSKLGKTGIGVDLSKSYLSSNNLGDHNRFSSNIFVEQRFDQMEKVDITLGLALSTYSDFNTQFLPGLELGIDLSDKIKLFGNVGYTYRVPTYTDLYYSDPANVGNPELQPESAIAEEIGLKYFSDNFNWSLSLFNRDSENLIDWTKTNSEDKWQTQNFSSVSTKGIEFSTTYNFLWNTLTQGIQFNYSYVDDSINDEGIPFTRYALNSLKHQLNMSFTTRFFQNLSQTISYRYVERTSGDSYNLVDAKLWSTLGAFELSLNANNIFNTAYVEVGQIPMPKGNVMFGLKYRIY